MPCRQAGSRTACVMARVPCVLAAAGRPRCHGVHPGAGQRNLRALLDDDGSFQKYLQDQKDQADDWKGLQPAFGDVLDSRGNKLLTRLFTYVTVDGKIGTAQVVSPKAAEVIADKHYDKLADLWTKNDPRSRYWFEDFLGPLLTCSWFPKKFDAYHITDKNSIGKANWERTPCDSLVIDAGLQLLRCDTKDIFERKWSQAVKNGSLEKCLLQSPEQYLGVDYLLGLNHGISATTGPKHSIAKSFLEKLRDIFQHCKGQEFRAFMEMESFVAAQDFARGQHIGPVLMPESLGAPGLRKRTTVPRPGTRASGLSAGLVGCQDRLDLEEAVIAEAERVLDDNDTVEKIKAVLRRWSSTWVTSRHPGRGGVALRASPQQDSDAEAGLGGFGQDWLAKSRKEVEGFSKAQVSNWVEAVLLDAGFEADDITEVTRILLKQKVIGAALLQLTLEELMQDGVPRGPAKLLDEKIRLLQEVTEKVTAEDFDLYACARPDIKVQPDKFVDLDVRVENCVNVVMKNLPKETEGTTVRVPPAMLSRCMRGGKTTMLYKVFDKLKATKTQPIFISFNGDSLIHRLDDEKPLHTMLRAIAVALMKNKPANREEAERVRCSKEALKEYLEDKKDVVLLVDEPNVLLKPNQADNYQDVGMFLRETFLDPAGRHLVFSTHIPTSTGLDRVLGKGAGSSREAETIPMPRCADMEQLRAMHPACDALTPLEAVYLGYVPALIFSVKTQVFDIEGRFRDILPAAKSEELPILAKTFLSEFFIGKRGPDHDPVRAFDALTESPQKGQIRWILAYVGQMCCHLGWKQVGAWIEELPSWSGKVESGQDWETVLLVALCLRCYEAKYSEPHELLGLAKGALRPAAVYVEKVPQENSTNPEVILAWWKGQPIDTYPYIAVLSPTFSKTEIVDAMWVYQKDATASCLVRGMQAKLGSAYPKQDMPLGMLGLLFRGKAPETSGNLERQRWKYLTASEIQSFLGTSLTAAYPENWLQFLNGRAMDTISNLTFKQSLEKAVGVAVSFNCDAAPVPGEEPQFMLGVRMVFGHFLDATKTPFPKFLAWLRRLQRLEITETEAWEMIDRDVWEHFQESRDMILTVDEPLQLRALITSAMRLITAGRVHVLMTSLSGADLDEAANGRTVHFLGFQRLDKEAVDNLVEAEDEKTRSRLKGARFEFLLRECAGVPRLIEKVFEVARSPAMNDKSSCDAIRVWVGTKFQQLSKYKNRNHRSAALVSALSFHAQSQAREDQTRAAEREGYLFDGLIPPLLLKWWWVGPDEQGVLDEAHALLKSACEICAMSDVLGGAQHGPNFEKQMASLWKMLTITDSIFRREEGRGQPRSILGMLGGNRLPAASRMVSRYSAAAAFDKPLREVATWSLLKSKEEFQGDLPVRMELNTCYFPKSPSYSGFDFALLEPYGDQGVLVLVECKFSKELATTKLSTEDIVNKFVLALRNCPNIQGFLAEGRLCFVIGGLRECTVDVEAAATEIVGKLKKVGSLKTELAKGLRYTAPLPLLQTNGANWDYCGADDMVMHLAPDIQELPVFINATQAIGQRRKLSFLLTLENDSPQKRNIIPLPLVRDVRRDGKPVFDWRGNACLDDPDATAFIQELVNAKPKDLGEGRQDGGMPVFDLKTCLPAEPYDLSGRKLLTELMKDGTRRVAMLGTPGIGKSSSLALGLWHLVSGHRPDWIKTPEAIVYEAREGLKVFIFTNKDGDWKAQSIALEDWKPGSCEHLQNSDNWYLVDTYGKETTGKLPAKTVKACSPDREHYTDFVKSGGACVYVEAWKKAELELAYVHFAQPPVDKDTVLRRFQYVGGNLRALLDDDGSFQKYLQDQKDQADDWKGLQPAFGDVLDSRGNKLLTRLFTYVTVDGKIGTAQVVSPKAAEVIADKHYDKLADLWTKNDPRSRYWFEDFLGPLLTCSWFPKKFDAYHITDKNSIGKANWERTPCDSLVIDAGLQLLRCDTKDIFERKWSQAVKNGSLEKCLLQSPEQYLGVDYLLGLNHGISTTTGPKHSIAKSFLEKLRDIFQHCKGQYSFTLSFFTTGDPTKFAPESGQEFRAFMEMARGPNKVFKNVHVQVVQVPKTRNSMEKV
ncbi:unnamed protein product [Effrenium voratum]|nr:unnamed protein product [Effrenium voratum]